MYVCNCICKVKHRKKLRYVYTLSSWRPITASLSLKKSLSMPSKFFRYCYPFTAGIKFFSVFLHEWPLYFYPNVMIIKEAFCFWDCLAFLERHCKINLFHFERYFLIITKSRQKRSHRPPFFLARSHGHGGREPGAGQRVCGGWICEGRLQRSGLECAWGWPPPSGPGSGPSHSSLPSFGFLHTLANEFHFL